MNELEKIRVEDFDGNHKAFAEELLIPNSDKTDGGRQQMAASQQAQAVIPDEPEIPRVYTNFENQVGRYSNSYKKAEENLKVIKIIKKNDENSAYIVEKEDGKADIIFRNPARRITEYFGYRMINNIDSKHEGDVIEKDEVIYHSTAYDGDLNYMMGKNLNTIYLAYKGLTYEDGIVISESASKAMGYNTVEEITVNINTNDILVNMYGDANNYKPFPDIGEYIKDKILLVRRRINYDSALFDLTTENLMTPNHLSDQIFFSKGKIIDVDVYCNAELNKLRDRPYYDQIMNYVITNDSYYQDIVNTLEPYIESGMYTDEVGFYYKRFVDALDPEVKWKNDSNNFDNVVVKFTIMNRKDIVVGSKISNRYGAKGVVSLIVPDDQMPITKCGKRADIIMNPLGVANRLNLSQLYEHEINFISDRISDKIRIEWEKDEINVAVMQDLLFGYIKEINESQCKQLQKYYNDLTEDEEILDFWESIINDGIYIHQPPFYGNITFDKLGYLYDKYDIKPLEFVGIEEPLIISAMYFWVLKHHPDTKFSSRSSSYLNLKSIPSKSSTYKEHLQLYSKTPIRLGEMEVTNLFICNKIDEVTRLLSLYSTNEEGRSDLINEQLVGNVFNIEKIESPESKSRTTQILDIKLRTMGLELERKPIKARNKKE